MSQSVVAIVVMLFLLVGCGESMPPAQASNDEQRCVNSGGIWRANSFCEQPGGGRGGRR
jgi:hypothetical protein